MFDRYVGLPWVDKGRDFSGLDCWGLVFLANRERGLALPRYDDRYRTAKDECDIKRLIAGEISDWDEIAAGSEQPWDCVLMRGAHIGLVVAAGKVLHVARDGFSVIENYRVSPARHRVLGFYRYRG